MRNANCIIRHEGTETSSVKGATTYGSRLTAWRRICRQLFLFFVKVVHGASQLDRGLYNWVDKESVGDILPGTCQLPCVEDERGGRTGCCRRFDRSRRFCLRHKSPSVIIIRIFANSFYCWNYLATFFGRPFVRID